MFYILNHVLCTEIRSYVECENVFKMALKVCFGENKCEFSQLYLSLYSLIVYIVLYCIPLTANTKMIRTPSSKDFCRLSTCGFPKHFN